MKRIGVLGGTRFIGRHLTQALALEGHAVTTFTRGLTGRSDPTPDGVERVFGDRYLPGQVDAFLRRGFDTLFDFTAYSVAHIAPVLAARHAIDHYIFCSTSMVYRQPAAIVCGEDEPRDLASETYGGNKARAEDVLFELSARERWPVTIVRPHGVFGPFDAAQPGVFFSRLASSRPIVLNKWHRVRINPLYVGDLVSALKQTMKTAHALARVYNVAGPEAVDQSALASRCCLVAGAPADVRPVASWPYPRITLGVPWPAHDLVLSTSRAQNELELTFTPLDTALSRTRDWLTRNPAHLEERVPRVEHVVGPNGVVPLWARVMLGTFNALARGSAGSDR